MLRPRHLFAILAGFTGQILALTIIMCLITGGWLLYRKEIRSWAGVKFEPAAERWRVWAARKAERRTSNALSHLERVAPDTSRREWQRVVEAVRAWCFYAPFTAFWHTVKLTVILVLLFNIGTIVTVLTHSPKKTPWFTPECWKRILTEESSEVGACKPEGAGPFTLLWAPAWRAVAWVGDSVVKAVTEARESPMHTVTTAVAVLLLVMSVVVFCSLVPMLWQFLAKKEGHLPRESRESRGGADPARESGRWRPVVVLLAVCGDIGQAHRRLESGNVQDTPRVSLKPVERVVQSAWRTRHGRARFARRRELAEHAAQVTGALRAMESRQDRDADTRKVLEDTTVMLLKISERYAAGRTLELLDPEDLEGVKPVVSREWLRAVFMATTVVGGTAGALVAGLPEQAATPLVGATSLIAWGIAYGGRMIGPGLVDVMRGQSRT